jgi:signal recognition particle receptor subunit beta
MVFFNYALRKLNAKIVYYGPGLCGKTTNLQWIHDHFEGGKKGNMLSLATEGDRTIFFDLLPLDIGTIRGMEVTLQLYTVPGQVHYNSTRQLVLRGADGVVFVADSQRAMKGSNLDSWKNLKENLLLQGIELSGFPHVLQFNKRDLGDVASIERLDEELNEYAAPIFESVATSGIGVQETLEGIVKLVMRSLRERYETEFRRSSPGFSAPTPAPVTPTTPSPPQNPPGAVTQPPSWPVPQTQSPATRPPEAVQVAETSTAPVDYSDDSEAETHPGMAGLSLGKERPVDEEREPTLVIAPEDTGLPVPEVGEVELEAEALETADLEEPKDPWMIEPPSEGEPTGAVEPPAPLHESVEPAEPAPATESPEEDGEWGPATGPEVEEPSEKGMNEAPESEIQDMAVSGFDAEIEATPFADTRSEEPTSQESVLSGEPLDEAEPGYEVSEGGAESVEPAAEAAGFESEGAADSGSEPLSWPLSEPTSKQMPADFAPAAADAGSETEPFSLPGMDDQSEREVGATNDFSSAPPDGPAAGHQAAAVGEVPTEPAPEPFAGEVFSTGSGGPVSVWEGDPFDLPDEPTGVEVHALAPKKAPTSSGCASREPGRWPSTVRFVSSTSWCPSRVTGSVGRR